MVVMYLELCQASQKISVGSGKNCHGIVPMKCIFIQCSSNPEKNPEIFPVLFIFDWVSNI